MKKLVYSLLLMFILSSFTACGSEQSAAKVGDILQQPEKTVSLADLDKFTLTVSQEEYDANGGFLAGSTYYDVYSKDGDNAVYYIKTAESQVTDDSFYTYENLCVSEDGKEKYWYRDAIEDSYNFVDPAEVEYEEGDDICFNSNEFLLRYYYHGIDYSKYLDAPQGFEKLEDAIVNNRDCYVYRVKLTEKVKYPSVNDITIYVDKENGLWIKSEGTYEFNGDGEIFRFTDQITDVKYNADIIPEIPA